MERPGKITGLFYLRPPAGGQAVEDSDNGQYEQDMDKTAYRIPESEISDQPADNQDNHDK